MLLCAFRDVTASNDRDRIFAPAGSGKRLGGTDTDPPLVLDYNQTIEQVYVSVTTHFLRKQRSSAVLSMVNKSEADQNNLLPSWIPDLRVRLKQKPILWLSRCDATKGWPSSDFIGK